jgi:glutathione synthase/RimK-type ligase-like ATP-grasp enzyme
MSPPAAKPRRVALVTSSAYPNLYEDDLPLRAALESCGVKAVPAVWSDPAIAWDEFAVIVIRTPWDYFERLSEFRGWLDARIAGKVPLCNPGALLRWNLDKHYLRDLEAAGVTLVPTVFVEAGARPEIAAIARERGWTDLVVKPTISGGAYRTHRFAVEHEGKYTQEMTEILRDRALMVQPFLPEIVRTGELSLVFLEGEFSHAVRKRARAGDYRVQFQYGGTNEDVQVPPAIVSQAQACVRAAPVAPVYARVDGLVSEGRFVLMELEVLEPMLFLSRAPHAAMRFAQAIARIA